MIYIELRDIWNIKPSYKMVDTCEENLKHYHHITIQLMSNMMKLKYHNKKKVIVIGSGPIRIGQGIEFDYASVHCVKALKETRN